MFTNFVTQVLANMTASRMLEFVYPKNDDESEEFKQIQNKIINGDDFNIVRETKK